MMLVIILIFGVVLISLIVYALYHNKNTNTRSSKDLCLERGNSYHNKNTNTRSSKDLCLERWNSYQVGHRWKDYQDFKKGCPFCENPSGQFIEGPSGGGCVNFYCGKCRTGFNAMGPFGVELISKPKVHINTEGILNSLLFEGYIK